MNIGSNIKRLRQSRELTQQSLADVLGVSFQSVSKWECGDGFPDITLLPAIARFFGVTLDDLVGMDAERETADVAEIIEQVKSNLYDGNPGANIELLRDALLKYPNNYRLMHNLASALCLYNETEEPGWTELENRNHREAAEIYQRILAHCTDDEIRYAVKKECVFSYEYLGEKEKARELARTLPHVTCTCDFTLPNTLEGDERTAQLRQSIRDVTAVLCRLLHDFADAEQYHDTRIPVAERMEMLEKSNMLMQTVYDGGDRFDWLANNCRNLALLAIMDGDTVGTLMYLERAADYAIESDAAKTEPVMSNYSGTARELMADVYLPRTWYDAVRDDPRFAAIEARLRA